MKMLWSFLESLIIHILYWTHVAIAIVVLLVVFLVEDLQQRARDFVKRVRGRFLS